MEWYEQLDFDENPLNVETKYIGNAEVLDETFYSIVSGNILVVEGGSGSGKTKVLREVVKKFGGFGRVAYVDCQKLQKELNIEDVISKKSGLFKRLFQNHPKNMILLLDNVEHLTERNLERMKYYFDRNYLRSVILATPSYEGLNLNESLKQRVRKVIRLSSLSDYEAVQVARDRLGNELLSDRIIKEAYQHSDGNMKQFLENCEAVCKVHVQDKTKELTEDDVRTILARGEQ